MEPVEIHIYISGSFVVTVRRSTCTELDELHDELDTADPKAEHYIVYRIFDVLTDAFYPIIDLLEERIDALEARGAARRSPGTSSSRRSTASSRTCRSSRAASCPSATASSPARRRSSTCPASRAGRRSTCATSATTWRRSPASCTASRRTSQALTATYFNANANRLNRVATRLTIGGTFFLAWTLVTGFFGQNFGWLVGNIDSKHDFLIYGVGALVVPTVVIGAVFWVKRKDWF